MESALWRIRAATRSRTALPCHQHDLPDRPAGCAFNASQQFRAPSTASAAIMPHAPDDLAERHVPLRCVNLVQDPHLVAPVAGDAQIPARKRGERFDQGFRAVGSGWSPFERQCRTGGLRAGIAPRPACDRLEERLGSVPSPLVLLFGQILHRSERRRALPWCGSSRCRHE